MSIRHLYRYFNIAWRETCLSTYQEPNLFKEVSIRQVRVEPTKQVLDYNVTPIGPVLASESEELVTSGTRDFGLCKPDGSILDVYMRSQELERHTRNFDSLRAHFFRKNRFLETVTTMSVEVREAVLRRDHNTCCITGLLLTEAETVAVEWVIPPALLSELETDSEGRHGVWREVADDGLRDPARFECLKVVGNAITMHRDLVEMYRRNQLSIDVDDKYRIICLGVPKDFKGLKLQESLTINDHSNDRLDDRYLRRHFSRCIQYMIGGGIHDDYKYHSVKSLISDFGILEASIST
ncbi:hypothetical protein D9615_000879 [Tricholomella constricta]|uniref:Uncharacterized protein n=1 Tax=Tricholomella constricta TaxID=117010 RepID=A0A8H5M8T1_9AGAR|nr:hypothetical protein D9615_000879 [Tricholomella constricta]